MRTSGGFRSGVEGIALIGIWALAIASTGGTQRQVSARHLQIASYVTPTIVAPGARFSAILDIKPGPGIHVYAPEVKGYKPIRLRIEAQPGVVVRSARYPRSEIYFFPALEERVPVYQSPFQIVQDLVIDASRQSQAALAGLSSLTIKGVLEYQACDDKVCFRAESVPLSWNVKLRPPE